MFEITAAHDAPEGLEMLISYGMKKNADLLMEYGFVLSDNAWDCAIVYDNIMELIDDDEFRPETDTFKVPCSVLPPAHCAHCPIQQASDC